MTDTGEILVAKESFSMRYQGADHAFVQGQTRVRAGHPILKGIEHLFAPITPQYEYTGPTKAKAPEPKVVEKPEFEQATAAPNEVRGKK